jgi:hypothetical protein
LQYAQNVAGHLGASSPTRNPRTEIPANATEEAQPELIAAIIETSSIRVETEANAASSSDDNISFSNDSAIKSMRMIEIPRPKEMLLPMLDTTDDGSADEDLALKKIMKILSRDAKASPLENDGHSIDLNPDAIDDPREQAMQESTPVPAFSSDSRSNVDPVAKDRPSDDEDAGAGIRSKLRLIDGSVPGIVKVRMQNTSVIESGAMRLIYSVHLDGKPVPAETAARDMSLLSPQEVALELGAPVIIQSERE